jgi:putative aminopeptidase FrvX
MRRTLFAFLLLPALAAAQAPDPVRLAERFTRMTAVTGFEAAALDTVQALLPGARRDRAGNVIVERGSGAAELVVCPFDEVGYVVGGIRDDGWLTLRRVGTRAPNAIWDQYHEGQRVMVWGRKGALPAVVGVRSTHLQRGRNAGDAPFTVDDAVVDIGAANAAEARAAGADLLAPVAKEKQVFRYGDSLLAGPNVGRRSACAALAGAWLGTPMTPGRVVVAFVVEQELSQRGLRTIANAEGPFVRTTIVGATADTMLGRRIPGLGRVEQWGVPPRYPGTPVETVRLSDVMDLMVMMSGRIRGALQ